MLNETSVILVIAAIVLLFGINFTVRAVRTRRAPIGRIISLYRDVKYNEKLLKSFGYRGTRHRFRTKAWLDNKYDIDFLPGELHDLLQETFEDIWQINETIDAAVEGRGESCLDVVNVDPLKAPLKQIREELGLWIEKNVNNPEYAPKRPRFFGW